MRRSVAVALAVLALGAPRAQAQDQNVRLKPDATSTSPNGRSVRLQPDGPKAKPDVRLITAIKAGDKATALSLLRARGLVNAQEADGTTALHWAVRQDDLDLVNRLVRAGANVSVANRYGVTPLYLACVNGSAPIIGTLLEAGADANAFTNEGETALMTAARTGNVDAAKVLLHHGATVDAREAWRGQTPLMWAAAEGHPAMVRELVARGADVNARSALKQWERQVTKEPREKWLPPGGLTPLIFASREGCVECAAILVESGADVNATDPDGISPLLSSIINGHYDVAGLLLEKRADPNIADSTGRTPLYAAVDVNTMPASNRPSPKVIENRLSSLDLMKVLLDRGADPNARLKKQQPYRTKVDRGSDTMLSAGTTPFIRAAKAADLPAMRLLLARGADPKLATGSGVANDVSAPSRNPGGITGLMAAAGVGTREEDTTGRNKTQADAIAAIQLCLDAGLDVNTADGRGVTPLHGAATQGYDEIVKFLASRGAKLDVKDRRGFTPLDAALGKAGGFGFGGTTGVPRPSTAKLLRELMGLPESL